MRSNPCGAATSTITTVPSKIAPNLDQTSGSASNQCVTPQINLLACAAIKQLGGFLAPLLQVLTLKLLQEEAAEWNWACSIPSGYSGML
jgi:hypothetical protein